MTGEKKNARPMLRNADIKPHSAVCLSSSSALTLVVENPKVPHHDARVCGFSGEPKVMQELRMCADCSSDKATVRGGIPKSRIR
jgi:hypothetical protein